jgi:hypothetical protein
LQSSKRKPPICLTSLQSQKKTTYLPPIIRL